MLSSEIYSNTTIATSMATAAAGSTVSASTVATATTTTTAATTVQVVKLKQRRKRRKRAGHTVARTSKAAPHATAPSNPASNPTSPRPPASKAKAGSSVGKKCEAPYFQHDNRKCLTKYESFRLTATAHTLNYAAVARKFKPLRPALASGANKTRRTAVSRRNPKDCACACQQHEGILDPALPPALPMIQEPGPHRTAEQFIQRELPAAGRVLLELLKHSSSSLLESLLR